MRNDDKQWEKDLQKDMELRRLKGENILKDVDRPATDKKIYRDDHEGMFVNDHMDISDLPKVKNEIIRREQKERDNNNGKMISDSYETDKAVKRMLFKADALIGLFSAGMLFSLVASLFGRGGLVLGALLGIYGGMLFRAPTAEGLYKNNGKIVGLALIIPGTLMFLFNIINKDDSATLLMFGALLLAICIASYVAQADTGEYLDEKVNYPIEAECVDIIEEHVSSEDSDTTYYYPIFEIDYKGMHKRLPKLHRTRNKKKLPDIGAKRFIRINPDNFDEWYYPFME